MLVFLIGFMGCGKTTLGKSVAKKLNWQFIDLDHYIENLKESSIDKIFQTEGEEQFRKYEHEALLDIIETSHNIIISTGGGTPCYYNNIDIMNKHGLTIYLETKVGVLQNKLTFSKRERPLLKNMNNKELTDYINKKLSEREPIYKKAKYILDAKSIRIDSIIELTKS